jgi:hypothetical protein
MRNISHPTAESASSLWYAHPLWSFGYLESYRLTDSGNQYLFPPFRESGPEKLERLGS